MIAWLRALLARFVIVRRDIDVGELVRMPTWLGLAVTWAPPLLTRVWFTLVLPGWRDVPSIASKRPVRDRRRLVVMLWSSPRFAFERRWWIEPAGHRKPSQP